MPFLAYRFMIVLLSLSAFFSPVFAQEACDVQLIWQGRSMALDTPLLQKDTVIYLPLREFVQHLGAKLDYSRREDTYLLTIKKQTLLLIPNSKSYLDTKIMKTFSVAPVYFDGVFYVPLETFFSALGYQVTRKKLQVSISIPSTKAPALNKITDIDLAGPALSPRIAIKTLFPLKENAIVGTLSAPNTRSFELAGLYTEKPFKRTFSNPGPISEIRLHSLSATSSELSIVLNKNQPISALIPTKYGGTIHFLKELVMIKETYLESGVRVILYSKGNFLYNIAYFKNPDRLVLDLPNTITRIPSLISAAKPNSPYKRIRSAQYQNQPVMSRVVFDLKEAASVSINRGPEQLTLFFPYLKPSSNQTLGTKTHTNKPSPPKPKAPLALEGQFIVVDAGHGGDDPGALGGSEFYEKNYTLDIAKRVERLFILHGAQVMMTRSEDTNPSLEARTQVANHNQADLFVSVHINAFFNPFTGGTETFYYKYKDEALANAVHQSLLATMGLQDKGAKRARLYVLRNTTMPAVLVEPLFITNRRDRTLLDQPYFRQKIAAAIVNGVISYHLHNK